MPRLAVLFVLSAASSPCPDLNLIHYIRVSTTPRKLLTALHEEIGKFAKVRGFLGQVQYATSKDLINKFQKIELLKTDGSGIAESLLYKRKAFQHENEVRLIYLGQDGLCQEDIFKFDIKPTELFKDLLFDPRINPYLKEAYKGQIFETGEFKFKRSKLYDPPENFKFNL